MSELDELVKSPIEVELGGKTMKMSRLELRELAELERWVRAAPYRAAKRSIEAMGDVLKEEDRSYIISQAVMFSTTYDDMQGECAQAELNSVEGVGFALWLLLRREQPDLTADDVLDLVKIDDLPGLKDKIDLCISGAKSPKV